jgi:hypothetical protein
MIMELVCMLVNTLVVGLAFWAGRWSMVRKINAQLVQSYALGLSDATLTPCTVKKEPTASSLGFGQN